MKRVVKGRKISKFVLVVGVLFLAGNNLYAENTVRLPAKSKRICVGKSKQLIQLKQQADYWKVDGRGSNQSTWNYRGRHSILTLDYATADVQAACKSPGRQTYSLEWKLAFDDPNIYMMEYTVICEVCINRADGVALKANVRKAQLNLMRNDFEAMMLDIQKLKEIIDRAIDSDSNDSDVLFEIREKLLEIERTIEMQDREAIRKALSELSNLVKKIQ